MVTPHSGIKIEAPPGWADRREQLLDAPTAAGAAIINPQVWGAYAKRFEKLFGFKPQDMPDEPNWHASEKH